MADRGSEVSALTAPKCLQCYCCNVKFASLTAAMEHNRSPEHKAKVQEVTGVEKPAVAIEKKKNTMSEADRMHLKHAEDEFEHDFLLCPADVNFHEFLASQNIFQRSQR